MMKSLNHKALLLSFSLLGLPYAYAENDEKNLRFTGYKPEPAFYAIRTASRALSKGTHATLLFDKSAVLLVTDHTPFDLRGRTVYLSDELLRFKNQGGRILVSKYWADKFSLSADSLVQGAELLEEATFADEVFERRGKLLEIVLDDYSALPPAKFAKGSK